MRSLKYVGFLIEFPFSASQKADAIAAERGAEESEDFTGLVRCSE